MTALVAPGHIGVPTLGAHAHWRRAAGWAHRSAALGSLAGPPP